MRVGEHPLPTVFQAVGHARLDTRAQVRRPYEALGPLLDARAGGRQAGPDGASDGAASRHWGDPSVPTDRTVRSVLEQDLAVGLRVRLVVVEEMHGKRADPFPLLLDRGAVEQQPEETAPGLHRKVRLATRLQADMETVLDQSFEQLRRLSFLPSSDAA